MNETVSLHYALLQKISMNLEGIDVVNTDVWSQYTYSTPIESYIPSGLHIPGLLDTTISAIIDPYGTFYERYQQIDNVSSIFYFDWQYLNMHIH